MSNGKVLDQSNKPLKNPGPYQARKTDQFAALIGSGFSSGTQTIHQIDLCKEQVHKLPVGRWPVRLKQCRDKKFSILCRNSSVSVLVVGIIPAETALSPHGESVVAASAGYWSVTMQ